MVAITVLLEKSHGEWSFRCGNFFYPNKRFSNAAKYDRISTIQVKEKHGEK